jgi:drug/metabolite transporter (DMT)-like permease
LLSVVLLHEVVSVKVLLGALCIVGGSLLIIL